VVARRPRPSKLTAGEEVRRTGVDRPGSSGVGRRRDGTTAGGRFSRAGEGMKHGGRSRAMPTMTDAKGREVAGLASKAGRPRPGSRTDPEDQSPKRNVRGK